MFKVSREGGLRKPIFRTDTNIVTILVRLSQVNISKLLQSIMTTLRGFALKNEKASKAHQLLLTQHKLQ